MDLLVVVGALCSGSPVFPGAAGLPSITLLYGGRPVVGPLLVNLIPNSVITPRPTGCGCTAGCMQQAARTGRAQIKFVTIVRYAHGPRPPDCVGPWCKFLCAVVPLDSREARSYWATLARC